MFLVFDLSKEAKSFCNLPFEYVETIHVISYSKNRKVIVWMTLCTATDQNVIHVI